MKKVININFHGRVIPIEETAYELLKQYSDSLRVYFANEEGRDEIINDIESRIAELFDARLKSGVTCITDEEMNAIISNMGRPADFANAEGETENTSSQQSTFQHQDMPFNGNRLYRDENHKILGGVCSGVAAYFNIEPIIVRLVFIFSGIGFFAYLLLWIFVPASSTVHNGVRKRLFRDPENQLISGVCSGIAAYFNVNVWIPRVLFLLPCLSFFMHWSHFGPWTLPSFINFSFSPGSFLLYVILWMVVPEAKTTSDKLEMKGEKVDLNSIKNTVVEEINEMKDRFKKQGAEFKTMAQQRGTEMGAEIRNATQRTGTTFGRIIIFIAKMFAYFIVGMVAFSLIIALFALAIAAVGVFPLKNYIISSGWEDGLAWGTLIFFIGVPIVGVITFIIRRLAKMKRGSALLRYSCIALWIVGWFCVISLIASITKDFRSSNNINEETVALVNPSVAKLDVLPSHTTRYFNRNNWLHFEPFARFDDDTAYVNNIKLRIIRSTNDSFKVTLIKFSNGFNRRYADTLASKINYTVQQIDSALYIDKGIAINKNDKFRNQHVVITIAVPVGRFINISKQLENAEWSHFSGPMNHDNDWDTEWDTNEEEGWVNHCGQDLIMKTDGLYTLDGLPVNEERRRGRTQVNIGPVHIDADGNDDEQVSPSIEKKIDSLKLQNRQMRKLKDSLEKAKEQIDKKLEKIQDNTINDNRLPEEFGRSFMIDI